MRRLALSLLLLCSQAWAQVGVIGDSFSDEYRAEDSRGGAYASTTLNWVELLQRYRGVSFGAWGLRAPSRRTGYEFNWALSGSRAADLIAGGQAAGVAQQVGAGQVSRVIIIIGANDFASWNGTYTEIYSGALDGPALQAKTDGMVQDIAQAMDTIRNAGTAQIIVATIMDRGNYPAFVAQYPDQAGRQRVTQAIAAVNSGIASAAAARGAFVFDQAAHMGQILQRVDSQGALVVGGESISLVSFGDEPHNFALADQEHMGTVGGGLWANAIMDQLEASGMPLARFTDAEVLANAGIGAAPPPPPPPPPSAPTTVYPSSLLLTAGTHYVGTVGDLVALDGVGYVASSTSSGTRTVRAELEFTGVPAAPTVDVTLRLGATLNTTVTVYARDQAGAWIVVRTMAVPAGVVTLATFGAAQFVSAGSLRIAVRFTASASFLAGIDQAQAVSTP